MSTTADALRQSARDPERFGEVYEAHAEAILVFLARRTWDPDVAMELTAETFAQAFSSRRRFKGEGDDDVARWLHGIARHVLSHVIRRGRIEARALRKLGVDVPALEEDDVARIVELAGLSELRGTVARSFDELPADHREAVRLRVLEELPYEDVASRLLVSEQTARARVSRGLRRLALVLDPPSTKTEGSA